MDDDTSFLQRRALPVGRQVRAVLLVALSAAALLIAWLMLGRNSSAAIGATPPFPTGQVRLSPGQLATLQFAPVAQTPFHDAVLADGQITVNADTTTQVFSAYSGRIIKVLAGIGDHVTAGAPLVSLEATENLEAQSALVTALSQARLARLTEARRHAAYDTHGGSLQDWQQAQADLTAAESTLAGARGKLVVLGSTAAQIQTLEAAGAVVPSASITSPLSGLVTDRQVGPGQVVQAGSSTALFTIADLSTVWLISAVRDSDAAAIAPGQPILIQLPALPGRIFHARVQSVGTEVDAVTHRVMVRANVANAEGLLRPAMLASAEILTSAESAAPAVPETAIVREGDQAHVWLVRANNILEERAIITGRHSGLLTEVRQGLTVGERIVTSGSLFIDGVAQAD